MRTASTKTLLLDTAAGSTNLGDHIIVEAVIDAMPTLRESPRSPTHYKASLSRPGALAQCDVAVFAGTNILGSKLWRTRQWPSATAYHPLLHHKVIYCGVGWGAADQASLDRLSASIHRSLRHPGVPIGVRDTLSLERARNSGLVAEYVGCPTMWGLNPELPSWEGIREVVTTLTDYAPDPEADKAMLRALRERFSGVYVWLQGARDQEYLRSLGMDAHVHEVGRSLDMYDRALVGRGYVGTRLHAGIRAMQDGRPAGIIGVDHRATAIAADTGLLVRPRSSSPAAELVEALVTSTGNVLRLPLEERDAWMASVAQAAPLLAAT